MGVLRRWDQRNQRVLEAQNRAGPTSVGGSTVAAFVAAWLALRILPTLVGGWLGWVLGAAMAVVLVRGIRVFERRRAGDRDREAPPGGRR